MKHLLVTTLAFFLGIFVGLGLSYTTEKPDVSPLLRTDGGPEAAVGPNEAVVVFSPEGLFSKQEKDHLTKNVTQPLVLFHHLTGYPFVSVMVEKRTANAREVSLTGIQQNGAYGSFTQPINQAWVPECFSARGGSASGGNQCSNIPEKFKTLYPALYQEAARRAR